MFALAPPAPLFWFHKPETDDAVRSDPPVPPVRQPVFIQDAVTPFRGETYLSYLLRKDVEDSHNHDA